MFVKSEHYNARKEETLNDEGQVISTKVKWDCKHCGWSTRDNATDMKKHLTKCQKTNSELKESMKTELREGSYKKRVRPSTSEDEAKPEAPTSDLNPALVMVKSKKAYHSQKQNTISEFTEKGWFDAPLPQPRQKLVDQKLATWIYATGQDLDMVDNGYFQDFVASLRTTYAPPSRWKVGESLLDSCYDRVEAEVKGYFDRAPVLIGASDTWNDVMGKSVTNLMLLTPEPFFLDSWMSDERRKTATNEAEKLISRLKPFEKKLVSFISDTENKMKAVHKELYQELTPETLHCLLCFFCTAHVLSLLLGDIFEQIAYFHDALDLAKKVVHFHKQHTLVHTLFERVRKDPTYITRQKGVMHLVTASPTRWGDQVTVVESVAFNRHALRAIQLEDAWADEILKQAHVKQEAQDMEVVLNSATTFALLETVVAITSPIRSEITYFEGDQPLLQEVWPRMNFELITCQKTANSHHIGHISKICSKLKLLLIRRLKAYMESKSSIHGG